MTEPYGLEDKIQLLHQMGEEIKQAQEAKDELRDEVLAELEGSRLFLDAEGNKRYAFRVDPESVQVDDSILEQLPASVVEEVAPRKIDKKKLEQAVKTGRVPAETYAAHATIVPGTPHVRFGDSPTPRH